MSSSPTPPGGAPTNAASQQQSSQAAAAAAPSSSTKEEETLRQQLRSLLHGLKRREPLDPTYKRLLLNGVVTARKPALPANKFYKRIGSRLRQTVEQFCQVNFGKDPFDSISLRRPVQALEEDKLRAAFTLREFKEHEQVPLLEATLAALPKRQGVDEWTRRRHLDGVVMALQQPAMSTASAGNRPNKKQRLLNLGGTTAAKHIAAAEQTERARQAAELDQKRQDHLQREQARQQREEEDRKKRQMENSKRAAPETPQQALHKFYYPIFKLLWDMEFPYLGNTNPFRMVIDRDNCASVGAPDYFDVIDQPMNLTYIQRKVNDMEYESLSAFFQDVDLMIKNALTYNSDKTNPYRVAAEEMQKKYKRAAKRTVQTIQKKHGTKT